MKKLIMLALGFCLLTSCASIDKRLSEIPKFEFTEFRYNRTGNVTSSHIEALNSKKTGKWLTVESISIKENFGPAFNVDVLLKGYRVKVED